MDSGQGIQGLVLFPAMRGGGLTLAVLTPMLSIPKDDSWQARACRTTFLLNTYTPQQVVPGQRLGPHTGLGG